jgi:hypothetical protein
MSISFAGIAAQSYIGAPFNQPVQIAGTAGRAVKFNVTWLTYGGGSANQNIVISANCQAGAGTNQTQLLDLIRSVYIDNTGNPLPVYIQFPDTEFTVTAAPYSTGWYPVFTNLFTLNIACLGLTNANVNNNGMLNATLIYVTNIRVVAYSDTALQSVENQELASPVSGGGSSIADVLIVTAGSGLANGNLSVTGGGGENATVSARLDQFGSVIDVDLVDAGNGFITSPVIETSSGFVNYPIYAPGVLNAGVIVDYAGFLWEFLGDTGTNTNAPVYAGQAVNAGQYVTLNGFAYLAIANNWVLIGGIKIVGGGPSGAYSSNGIFKIECSVNPVNGQGWLLGPAPAVAPAFNALLTAASQSIVTSGLGPPALGDQAQNFVDIITATGIIRDNLFGTPAQSGFIYLTHIDVNILDIVGAGADWVFENQLFYAPFVFNASINTEKVGRYLSLQKMNMKLDATQTWRLLCTAFGGNVTVSTAFVWTYSQF